MGRPKGSKNKPKPATKTIQAKTQAKTQAKAKARPPAKAEPPEWLRKAMAVKTPTRPKVGRKPNAVKEKFAKAKARRGKTMANISKDKPLPDPELDPDFGAPAARFGDAKPSQLPAEEQVKLPEEKRTKGTKLTEEQEPEPAPVFDEVQSGAEIPYENAEALIAGTMGGSGDNHAMAKRILQRMKDDANWVINKGLDAGIGDTRKGKDEDARRAKK